VPKNCLVGYLHLSTVPRIKFAPVELDTDDAPPSDNEIVLLESDPENSKNNDEDSDLEIALAEADAQRINTPVVPIPVKKIRKRTIKPKDDAAVKRPSKEQSS
jgi:hypothetical protein